MDELSRRENFNPAVINDHLVVESFRSAIERRQQKVHEIIEKVEKATIAYDAL